MRINNITPIKNIKCGRLSNNKPMFYKNRGCDMVSFSKNIETKGCKMTGNAALDKIIEEYSQFENVRAIAIGGSSASGKNDSTSDIDLYVFLDKELTKQQREELVKKHSTNYEVGGDYFGPGDEYYADDVNRELDVMFWDKKWFEDIVDNVWTKHNASNGYTTCFLYTLNVLDTICDKDGWLNNMKLKLNSEYPKELQENIINRNMMLMYDKPFSSYYEQIEKGIKRNDRNSVNHRTAAYMESYFDVIFAANKLLHPGEKRLVRYALDNCKILPEDFEENINKLFNQPNPDTMLILSDMTQKLKKCLKDNGLYKNLKI